jgi:hypothetical protein
MTGINQMLKICWEIVTKSRNVNNDDGNQTITMVDNKTTLQALSLINDCNKYKMDLTTNGVVITDAIKFVKTNKEKLVLDCYFYWNLNRCFTFQKKIYPLLESKE